MILFRRIIPFFAPAYLAVILLGLFSRSQEWGVWIAQLAVLTIFSIALMVEWKFHTVEFWILLFPVLAFFVGGVGLLFVMNTTLYILLLCAALVIGYGVYLESVFTYRYQPQKYTQLSLPNIVLFMNTFTGFALFATVYALQFLNIISLWSIPLTAALFTGAMMWHLFYGFKLNLGQHKIVVALVVATITELAWTLQFWPTTYFVNGIIMAIVLYYVPSVIQMRLRQVLTRRLLVQYSIVSILAIVAVCATIQWI